MGTTSIFIGLLVALFTILLLQRTRKLKSRVTGYGTQRMCPSCGLITSRLEASSFGVRQVLYRSGVLDCREMKRAH
jgi:hypothetical protein